MVDDSHVTLERVLCQKWEVADRKGILLQGALEAVKKFAENTQWYIKDILSVTTLSVVLHNAKMMIDRVDIAMEGSDLSSKNRYEELLDTIGEWEAYVNECKAEIARFKEYVCHKPDCDFCIVIGGSCTCGLEGIDSSAKTKDEGVQIGDKVGFCRGFAYGARYASASLHIEHSVPSCPLSGVDLSKTWILGDLIFEEIKRLGGEIKANTEGDDSSSER